MPTSKKTLQPDTSATTPTITKRRGTPRPNAGKPKRNIRISAAAARTLKTLMLARRAAGGSATEEQLVEAMIDAQWHELDRVVVAQVEDQEE